MKNTIFLNKNLILVLFTLGIIQLGYSQNSVGIGTTTPDANAILDLRSSDQGLLVPRLTTAQRTTLNGSLTNVQNSLLVFDTDINALNYYNEVSKPQAFAITIEPRGGSVSPTMEKMVVVGNVGS